MSASAANPAAGPNAASNCAATETKPDPQLLMCFAQVHAQKVSLSTQLIFG
jgi:hypothetical protein